MDDTNQPNGDVLSEDHLREMEKLREYYDQVQNSREMLCLHEAGHAVVAAVLGMKIVKVYAEKLNHSFTEITGRSPSLENLHDDLTMAISGYNAVLKETADPYAANTHAGRDYADIDKLFQFLSIQKEQRAGLMNIASKASKELIEKHWSAVKQVAAELLTFPQMNGGRVVEIVRAAETQDNNPRRMPPHIA